MCPDAFLGPVCDYVIAPVSRYAGVWNLPVLTAGAQVDHFTAKHDYPTITRMMGGYQSVGEALKQIVKSFKWSVMGIIFYNHPVDSNKGNSKCFFTMNGVYNAFGRNSPFFSLNDTDNYEHYKSLLEKASESARSKFSKFQTLKKLLCDLCFGFSFKYT